MCRTEGRIEMALVHLASCDESVAAIRFACWHIFLSICVGESPSLQDGVLCNTLHQAY